MKKRILVILLIVIFSMISTQLYGWFDEALFNSGSSTYSIMKPNILILMDNSGSMNNLIFHPDYNPATSYNDYSDRIYPDSEHMIEQYNKQTYYDPHDDTWKEFPKGWYFGRRGTTEHTYPVTETTFDGVFLLDIRDYPNTGDHSNAHPDLNIFAGDDAGNEVRIHGNLLNFLIYDATDAQRTSWNQFPLRYGTWDQTKTDDIEGNWGANRKVRIRVSREVMKNVVDDMFAEYDADTNPDKQYPRFGIARFNSDEGGTVIQSCGANANSTATKGLVDGIKGDSWTPLSETYAELYAYFRNGGECSIADDKYFLDLDDPGSQQIASSTPVEHWCQLNFIIVVTDGEPTQDVQLRDLGESTIFHIEDDNSAPWGDTDVSGVNDDDTDTSLPSDGTNYLDDLAWYAYNMDLWPDDSTTISTSSTFDTKMKNKQFIYTYTVGFAIDNVLLRDTAANGGGEYYTAQDYDSLTQAMANAFASIDEKVRAYAAFAAPKYSLTYGDRSGYVATFVPKATQSIWEGHLKSYKLDENGDFPDLENPGTGLEWDAGEILNNRSTARVIYTIKDGNLVSFDSTGITAADLGFATVDSVIDDANRDKVFDFIRGNNTYGWKLGDIFHFTPVVVGAPLKWKADSDDSYELFFDELTETITVDGEEVLVSKRTEVVYVGGNDGMLHCFSVENGEELWAFIPPSFLPKLREIVPEVPNADGTTTGTHQYFIDGKAIAKDIKIAGELKWTDWKTVLIFSYGIGGESYCALDITDPATMKFLWEFNDPVYSAYSEGKPILARLQNDGTGKEFPAVILSGGYDFNEEAANPNPKGKSFFVLNAYSGNIVKRFVYDTSETESKVGSTYTHTNPGFKYCFAATPAALDLDSDGLTDYLYMVESGDYTGKLHEGGRIWKVNVNGDPAGWDPVNIYQAEDGQTMWLPPTLGYDQDYHLWLLFGTGHRPQPNNANNLTGQFIGMMDSSLSSALSNSDLTNVNNIVTNGGESSNLSSGFWFDLYNGSGEMVFEPYPIYVNKEVYFNTYVPKTTSTNMIDPCVQEGNQFIYKFRLNSGIGWTTFGAPEVASGKIQGSGLLSGAKYKVYIGSGVIGEDDIIDQKTIEVESVFGSMTWEEKMR